MLDLASGAVSLDGSEWLISNEFVYPHRVLPSIYELLRGIRFVEDAHAGIAAAPFSLIYSVRGIAVWSAHEEIRKRLDAAAFAKIAERGLDRWAGEFPFSAVGVNGKNEQVTVFHLTPTAHKIPGCGSISYYSPECYMRSLNAALRYSGFGENLGVLPVPEIVETRTMNWPLSPETAKTGYIGRVVFSKHRFSGTEWSRFLAALSLAQYGGIGAKRAWGMGRVAVVPGNRRARIPLFWESYLPIPDGKGVDK